MLERKAEAKIVIDKVALLYPNFNASVSKQSMIPLRQQYLAVLPRRIEESGHDPIQTVHRADERLRGLRQIEDERDCVQRAQQTQRTFLGEKPLELLLQPSQRWNGITMRKT